ncbi:MAG: hypothetical protein RL317_170, partial [Pseudomonadota bacterium]
VGPKFEEGKVPEGEEREGGSPDPAVAL